MGDGTTTVTLLAGEFMKQAKPYIEDGINPQVIIRSYRKATAFVSLIQHLAKEATRVRHNGFMNFVTRCISAIYKVKRFARIRIF